MNSYGFFCFLDLEELYRNEIIMILNPPVLRPSFRSDSCGIDVFSDPQIFRLHTGRASPPSMGCSSNICHLTLAPILKTIPILPNT